MKTRVLLFCISLFLSWNVVKGQVPEEPIDYADIPITDIGTMIDGCFRFKMLSIPESQFPDLQKPENILGYVTEDFTTNINLDCAENRLFTYYLSRSGRCRRLNEITSSTSSALFYVRFFINGIQVEYNSIPMNTPGAVSVTGSFDLSGNSQLNQLPTPGVYTLKAEVCSYVFDPFDLYNVGSEQCSDAYSVDILLLKNGDEFVMEKVENVTTFGTCQEYNAELASRCNTSDSEPFPLTGSVSFSQVEKDGNKVKVFGGVSFSSDAEGASKWFSLFDLSGSTNAGIDVEHNFSEIESTMLSETTEFELAPEEGTCEWLSIDVQAKVISSDVVHIDCDQIVTSLDETPMLFYYKMEDYQIAKCTASQLPSQGCFDDCPPIINKVLLNNGNRNSDCFYDIYAEQCLYASGNYIESYDWILPDQTVFPGPSLSNVPIGLYQLRVTNQCGDVYTVDVPICPDLETSEWLYEDETNQICTISVCNGGDCGGENFETTNCITAGSTPWYYNQATGLLCHQVICPLGEECSDFVPLLECTPPAYTNWEYNANTGLVCHSIICPPGENCGDFEPIQQCYYATFSNWDYSEQLGQCRREIYANGQPTGLVDQVPTVIEYSYNEVINKCYKITKCGGTIQEQEVGSPDYGNWSVEENNISNIVCSRPVVCFGNTSNTFEDENLFPQIEWTYDQSSEDCSGAVFCDGFWDSEAEDHLEAEAVYSNWSVSSLGLGQCSASISCEYNLFNTFPVNETFTTGTTVSYEVEDDSWSYYCLVEVECDEGNYSEMSQVGAVISSPLGNGNCLVQCSDSYIVELPCPDIAPFINTTGEIEINNPTEAKAYNEMIISYVKQEPLVSPNPSAGLITIEYLPENYEQGRLDIIASSGRVLKTIVIEDARNDINVDLTNYQDGMYLIRFLDADNQLVYQKRVVKVE